MSESSEYIYYVMACREATIQEDEIDLVLNGLSMVFHAIELVRTPEDTERAAIELTALFPDSEIIITHAGMIGILDNKMKIQNVEAEMMLNGFTPPVDNNPMDRYSLMFKWRKTRLTVIHGGVQ
jgi:hypothetical protein